METFADLNTFLFSLFENSPEGIAFLDRSGTIVSTNAAALHMANFQRADEVAGIHFTGAVAAHHRKAAQAIFEGALSGSRDEFETVMVRPDGTTLPAEIAMFPARNRRGEHEGVFVLVRDTVRVTRRQSNISRSSTGSRARRTACSSTIASNRRLRQRNATRGFALMFLDFVAAAVCQRFTGCCRLSAQTAGRAGGAAHCRRVRASDHYKYRHSAVSRKRNDARGAFKMRRSCALRRQARRPQHVGV